MDRETEMAILIFGTFAMFGIVVLLGIATAIAEWIAIRRAAKSK